jgi:hypothetical protein
MLTTVRGCAGLVHALSALSLLSMLAWLVRVQMSVLGRAGYIALCARAEAAGTTPASATSDDGDGGGDHHDTSAERAYMALAASLLERGVPAVVGHVRTAVAPALARCVCVRLCVAAHVVRLLGLTRATVQSARAPQGRARGSGAGPGSRL